MIWHYWLFNPGFKFQDSLYSDCHDLTMLTVNISDIAVIIVKNVDYLCFIENIIQSEAINWMMFLKIVGTYKKYCLKWQSIQGRFLLFLFNIYKMVDSIDIYNALNTNIRTVMKNPEMVKFVHDHLKTKKCVTMQSKIILSIIPKTAWERGWICPPTPPPS